MNNQVIEVLNKEHGQKVKKYWESRGVDTGNWYFGFNKEDGDTYVYYGVINGKFNSYSLECVKSRGVEIIELPKTTEELPIPRDVLVRNCETDKWCKRELLADLSKYNIDMPFVCRNKKVYETFATPWRCMKELPTEITKDQAEEMLSQLKGVNIKIK